MSSPISKHRKSRVARSLISAHQKLSHTTRIERLSKYLTEQIATVMPNDGSIFRCLDVGCGDMILAEKVQKELPSTAWTCMDIYPLPGQLATAQRWAKYMSFDGKKIPLEDKSHDLILLCDVLHHSGEAMTELLKECARVADYILIKDHYEYGFFSRQMLRLMDIVGNWGYGVSIPDKYFRPKDFHALCESLNLKILRQNIGLQLYQHLPLVRTVIRPKWHFIALVGKSKTQ